MANWMELPCDILGHVTSFLSLPDLSRFSVVCKSWCYLAKQKRQPPTPQLPWLVLKENNVTQKRTFFSLSENRHYCMDIPELCGQYVCGSSFGWLFTLDIHFNFRMINPFNRKSYDLPRLPPLEGYDCSPSELRLRLMHKVILDHDPSTTSDFVVMVVYGDKREIAFWRLDFSAWRLLPRDHDCRDHNWYSSISDVICFKGKFYAIEIPDIGGKIYAVDVGPDPKVQLLKYQPSIARDARFSYLVNFMGELILLRRWRVMIEKGHFITTKFDVHRLDLVEGKQICCDHIDDYSFFVGNNSSIVINPKQLHGCKKNSIYFTDVAIPSNRANGRDDLGIYDLTRDTFSRYYPPEIYHPMDAAPIWMNPNP